MWLSSLDVTENVQKTRLTLPKGHTLRSQPGRELSIHASKETRTMSLKEYHKKRDFRRTREPRGHVAGKQDWLFVVQKHDASRLHYDFRLQLGGVLKSWAVPKGPSLDPKVKRLAMHVEDHPVDYGDFEGIIPEGEYGGGTVMLWDRGWWEPEEDAERGYRAGKLKFRLHGEKLKGEWLLIRRGGRSGRGNEWLLFKSNDEEALAESEGNIVDDAPKSVKTGRTLDQIAKAEDAVWSSDGGLQKSKTKRAPKKATKRSTKTTRATKKPAKRAIRTANRRKRHSSKHANRPSAIRRKSKLSPTDVPGAVAANFNTVAKRVRPQLATLTAAAPAGDQWLHEIKFDGYRMICRKDGAAVQLFSRNENDWTARFSTLVESLRELPFEQAILDGEVCALADSGKTDFQELQNAMKEGRARRMAYYAFDILYADGYDLTKTPLADRKAFLEAALPARSKSIVYSKHVTGHGPDYFEEACKLGLEGIISKRADRPYYQGRSADWLKIKCIKREEFVIGGFTDPGGSRIGFGSLLLGYYDPKRRLTYAGRVGTGFDTRALKDLTQRLEKIEQQKSPFHDLTARTGDARHAHWVRPKFVGQIEFTEWTSDGRLRHPSFQGLREDKPADEVVRDRAVSLAALGSAPQGNGRAQSLAAKAKANPPRTTRRNAAKAPKNAGPHKIKYSSSDRVDVAGVSLSSPDKLLYREQGITKLQLAQYYEAIGDWVLPELAGRPLVMVRCPEGTDKECFFQKHPGAGSSKELRQIPVKEKKKTEHYLVIDDLAGVIALVQMGVLEIHTWGSRADRIEQPDRLIFDLDPDPTVDFSRLVEAAYEVRQFLEDLDLQSFVKTTGGKGLHVVAPISRRLEWDDVKEFCRLVATAIVRAAPDHYTANMSKAARPGKIFLDYLRNGRGASAIAPYSSRARTGAPVAMPVAWDELRRLKATNQFNITNAVERLRRQTKDPWADIAHVRQSISVTARKKLVKLASS
jgi:bifunctional non-homologous end joining protein LigD